MRAFILASILTVASCASLDNLAYLPPNQRSPSPNPLSNQYLPASNQRTSGAFGATSGNLGGTSGSFSFNQNGGGLNSGQRANGAFVGGSSSGSSGGASGSFSFNQNEGGLALGQSANQRANGAFGGSNNGFGNSFNQIGQTVFRQSSNQQGLSTSYGGYSGAGNSLGQTDVKNNINQGVSGLSSGGSAGSAFGQVSGAVFKNQANSGFSGHSSSVGSSSGGYAGASSQGLGSSGNVVPILKLATDNNGDGTYRFSYETANSISAEEQGDARNGGTKAQGSFGYSAPDGQQVSISYTADENGFVPQGSHIPTAPPIPEAILKSIEENAAAAAKGIYIDGAYRGEGENEGQYKGEGLDAAVYNSNTGSGFGGASSSSTFQGSFGSSGIGNFNANGANNEGYKY